MASVRGAPRSYHKKYKFIIEANGIECAEFEKCSKLEAEIAASERNEGGRAVPRKNLGRVKVSDLTLTRGACTDKDLWKWFTQAVNMVEDTGLNDDEYKKDLDIVVQNRNGTTIGRWRCYKCQPGKYSIGDWDGASDDDLMEEMVIPMESFEYIAAS